MNLKPLRKILILAPHTDDGELGAGGTIARWSGEEHEVHYVAFSACESVAKPGFPPDVLRHEVMEATSVLGIPSERVRVLDFEVRNFQRDRQRVLQTMVELHRELTPDVVLTPALDDLHQDHSVVALEGLRAFKRASVLNYEMAWNNVSFESSCFVKLQEAHLNAKIASLGRYRSQAKRPYANADFLRAQMLYRGVQAGTTYAEAFTVKRWFL